MELQFRACLIAANACVHVVPPESVRLRADQTLTVAAELENWGRSPARTSTEKSHRALSVREYPLVPSASGEQAGKASVHIRVTPRQLPPGAHRLSMSLRIEGGDPGVVEVPVRIDVAAGRNFALRPATIAALVVLFLLVLLFIIAGGSS
jgi:hypothetical protein